MATNRRSRVDALADEIAELSAEEREELRRRLAEMSPELTQERDLVGAEPERKEPLRDIMELEGLGKELWRSVDVEEYLRQERDSWDS